MGLVRLARRVRDELHADFASAALFEYRTVDALAAHLGGLLPPVARTPVEADAFVPHPLSEGQRGLWSLQRSAPDASVYNVPLCSRCPASTSAPCAPPSTASASVTRCSRPSCGGTATASVRPARDRAGGTHRARADRYGPRRGARSRLRAHAREPFDLENGPPVPAERLPRRPRHGHLLGAPERLTTWSWTAPLPSPSSRTC
ncbi:hypothetical protein LV779_34595 [Streptomyces thinghirensis]|nr:hypothetical protein [Streptomyces thinghirensis]